MPAVCPSGDFGDKDEAWAGRSDAFARVSDHIATAIGGAALLIAS